MEKIDFKKLANDLMFDLSKEELISIEDDFELLIQQLSFLDKIDTNGVKEMIYPFEEETSFMRDDEVSDVLSVEDVLANAHTVRDGMVVVPKVM